MNVIEKLEQIAEKNCECANTNSNTKCSSCIAGQYLNELEEDACRKLQELLLLLQYHNRRRYIPGFQGEQSSPGHLL